MENSANQRPRHVIVESESKVVAVGGEPSVSEGLEILMGLCVPGLPVGRSITLMRQPRFKCVAHYRYELF